MKLTTQEAQLTYEALRVVNTALCAHKIEIILAYNAAENAAAEAKRSNKEAPYVPPPILPELDATFNVHDALYDLLQKFEKALCTPKTGKKRKPKGGKNERRT